MQQDQARHPLEQAVATLAREMPNLSQDEACTRIAWLRRQAVAEGFMPTAMVAEGLSDAIRREGRQAPIAVWLDALGVAAGCGVGPAEVASTLLATVQVRFAA